MFSQCFSQTLRNKHFFLTFLILATAYIPLSQYLDTALYKHIPHNSNKSSHSKVLLKATSLEISENCRVKKLEAVGVGEVGK